MDVIGVPDSFKPTDYAPYSYVSSGNKMYMKQTLATANNQPFSSLLASIVLPTENSAIGEVYLNLSGSVVVTSEFGAYDGAGANIETSADIRAVEDPVISMLNNISINIGGQSFNVQNVDLTSRALNSYFEITDKDTFKNTQRNTIMSLSNGISQTYNKSASTSFITGITYTIPTAAADAPITIATITFSGTCRLPISIFKVPIYNINAATIQINCNPFTNVANDPTTGLPTAQGSCPFRVIDYTIPNSLVNYTLGAFGGVTPMSATLYYTVSSSFSPIPKMLKYVNIDYQVSTSPIIANIALGAAIPQFTSGTLTSSSIPNGYLVFIAGRYNGDRIYLPIRNITASFMNKSSLLANADQVQLWRMAKNNGYDDSLRVFAGPLTKEASTTYVFPFAEFQNSMVGITFSYVDAGALFIKVTDLNIDEGLYPGMAKQAQFSCTVNSLPTAQFPVQNVQLYVLPIYEEVVTMVHNSATRDRVFVSSTPTGGSFLNDFLGTAKDVWNLNIPGLVMRVVDSFGSYKKSEESSSLFD